MKQALKTSTVLIGTLWANLIIADTAFANNGIPPNAPPPMPYGQGAAPHYMPPPNYAPPPPPVRRNNNSGPWNMMPNPSRIPSRMMNMMPNPSKMNPMQMFNSNKNNKEDVPPPREDNYPQQGYDYPPPHARGDMPPPRGQAGYPPQGAAPSNAPYPPPAHYGNQPPPRHYPPMNPAYPYPPRR